MMKRTDNPSFNQAPESVNVLSMNFASHVFALTMSNAFTGEAFLVQLGVARVLISRNQGYFVRDGFLHEPLQGLSVSVLRPSWKPA